LIGLIDYDAGNLFSVRRALEHIGESVRLVRSAADIDGCDRLVLPGVGAFGAGAARLQELGLWDEIPRRTRDGMPLLGICLGMQLLCRSSTERGNHAGLGLFDAEVVRLPEGVTCPHMGWNRVDSDGVALHEATAMYFAHSFYVKGDAPGVVCTAVHGTTVAAVMRREQVWAVQFHPEKSGEAGLMLLRRFAQMT